MPYISAEETKAIRNALKAKFPKVKFSVVNRDHSSVDISIMQATVNEVPHVNHFWLDRIEDAEARNFLESVLETVYETKPRKIVSEDGDYGSIPNYYLSLGFGKWNKPYVKVA